MKRILLSLLVALALGLTGAGDALAKMGSTSKSSGGSSMGSKGSRTYDKPMERSLTPLPPGYGGTQNLGAPSSTRPGGLPNTPPAAPVAPPKPGAVDAQPLAPGAMRPGMTQPMGAAPMAMAQPPGFFQRNPFMAGLAGGLVGAGIGSMLFGHSPALAAASEAAPGASFMGLLVQLLLIGGLVWLGFRLFRGRREAPANPYAQPQAHAMHLEPQMMAAPPLQALPRVEKEFEPAAPDQEAFTEILLGIQSAWSDGDLAKMKRLATPEMVMFMSEDLNRNASEGLMNKVEKVALLKGDVTESWSENGFDYVTAVLVFQCVDYMVREDSGAVVSGSPSQPVQHAEAWTFVRSTGGGRWLLSAVEQV
jgi:predicted lipid-binding transport protein (Tim44 family)